MRKLRKLILLQFGLDVLNLVIKISWPSMEVIEKVDGDKIDFF